MNELPVPPRALIAEDEPLLAQHLGQMLRKAWPELTLCDVAEDGIQAVQSALARRPDILFFDIRMPGQTGLEAAAELVDAWPEDTPFPALVFVTAYDHYAIEAFEAQAMDYLLKPVAAARLLHTVNRLRQWWTQRQARDAGAALQLALRQLQQLQPLMRTPLASGSPAGPTPPAPQPLQWVQASVGNTIHMVAVNDIVYLEAADKYVRVLTATQEFLIRTPLKELLVQLDPVQFWQVHRGTVVRAASIASARRDETGRLTVALRERPETLAVSRLYAQQFRSM
ncbi:MAG: LytTR family DNA-binding domain-containing protein [Burkholderiaceae bacterium]|jgi:DNA-binding LytR/AlgR family response regulator|nr:LytTR family DNA-binding domain-containing protein [Burkholderiaceae bacterium]